MRVNDTTKMLLLVAALGLLPATVAAQEPTRRVSLEEALGLFATNNLELRLARSRRAEAAGLARQANAFPNPTAAVTHEPLSRNGQSYSETYMTISQRFELPGERSARAAAANGILGAAEARVRADSARLGFTVKRAFVEAAMAEDRLAISERVAEVFRQGARSAAVREAEGDVSLYELRRLLVERTRYENLLADAGLAVSAARRALTLLLLPEAAGTDIAPGTPLGVLPPEPMLDGVLENAVSRRHEVAAARAEVEAALAGARFARAERIPDITAVGGAKRQSDGFRGVFLGLSIPLSVFDRNAGAVEATEAQVRSAEERLALTSRQVENDLNRAIESYRSLRGRSELLLGENLLDEDPDLLQIAQLAYDDGEMDLVQLLDAADALWNARTAQARLKADLWTAYYDLERAAGGFDNAADPRTTSGEIGR
jgi:cobalt-zinc-cadmium efflux system outer membrane protein